MCSYQEIEGEVIADEKWIPTQVTDSNYGERGRNRTYNLLIKSQLLCQLSYAPTVDSKVGTNNNYIIRFALLQGSAPFSRALVGLSATKFTRAWEPTLLWNQLRGCGFLALLRDRRCRSGNWFANGWFANRENFRLNRSSPFDSSDDRFVGKVRGGQGDEPVFAPQTIDQSELPRAQHWLRQGKKIPERPNQRCALHEIRL